MSMLDFSTIAGVALGTISFTGFLINLYIFLKLSTRKRPFSSFNKLCMAKTIPNITVCVTFLAWTSPLCFLHPKYSAVPKRVNVALGQVSGWGSYILSPLIQVCMSFNRFYVLFFSTRSIRNYVTKFSVTEVAIGTSLLIAVVYTGIGIPDGCGFVFDPDLLSWRPEEFPCAESLSNFIFYSVITLSVISNSLNFAIFLKLVSSQIEGLSAGDSARRRKRKISMYIQSVLQDTLHLIDMINCTVIFRFNSAIWYQFIFLSLSFLLIHALDGCVMLYFHTEIYPKWWLKRKAMVSRNGTNFMVKSVASIHISA